MANDSMGNLEKLGILVIVILVVVVGVVAITPSKTLFDPDPAPGELEDEFGPGTAGDDTLRDSEFAPRASGVAGGIESDAAWPGLETSHSSDSADGDVEDPLDAWLTGGARDRDVTLRPADLPAPESNATDADGGSARAPLPPRTDGGAVAPATLRPTAPATTTLPPTSAQPPVTPSGAPPPAARTPVATFTEYTVRDGDTLSGIAKRLTPGRSWTHIARANPDIDPNLIKAKTVLRIPTAVAIEVANVARRSANHATPVVTERAPATRMDGGPTGGGTTTYVVRSGDSLSKIAARTLGSGKHWPRVYDANRDLLSDPNHVRTGMTLRIPTGGVNPRSAGTTIPATPTFGSIGREGDQTYVVRGGDTLSDIAQRFLGSADRWREILDLNRDTVPTPEKLRSGITIRLP